MNTCPFIYRFLTTIFLLFHTAGLLYAQNCINRFSVFTFNTSTYETITASAVTASNEIISAGKLFDYNHAGHIAKYSEKGSPIWSYTYKVDYFDFVKQLFFGGINTSEIVATDDGGIVIAGSAEQVLPPFGQDAPVKKWGLLAKIDRFGKVTWNKTLQGDGDLQFTNVYKTSDGNFIAYLAADNGYKRSGGDHSYNRVLKIGADGKIKWSTYLFTFLFDAGGLGVNNKRAITQLSNGNIVIGDVAHKTVATTGQIREGNFHFFELDYNTGNIVWETSHEYGAPYMTYVPDLVNVKESANGQLSFITTMYTLAAGGLFQKAVNIITDNHGVIQNIITYSLPGGNPCQVTGTVTGKNNSNRVLLLNSNSKQSLLCIDDNGQPLWQKGYINRQGTFPVTCFSAGRNGFNIFTPGDRIKQYGFAITDSVGNADCINETSSIITGNTTLDITHDSMRTDPSYQFDAYYDYGYPLTRSGNYPLDASTICRQTAACCKDINDTTHITSIHICEGRSYMLPDSTVIQDPGTYYVTYRSYLGCDSIKYYRITMDKDVNKLSLGKDTCLGKEPSITINATPGFEKYYWMNNLQGDTSSSFTAALPGKYSVSVQNSCGNKEVQVEVFDSCEYSIYIPSAFTPNADGKNDLFRIPPLNKNRLLHFTVYNRWGKIVFQTTDAATGWDGTFNNEPLDPGTYIYFLEMEGITGKRLTKKGYVLLLR